VTRFAARGAKNASSYSTFQQNIFFEKTISKMAVRPVQRYSPLKTGPSGVPAAYRRDSSRYGLKQKSRNYIGVFRKNFFSFFCFGKKFYIGTRMKEWVIDSARQRVVRVGQTA
jgi:hypothetical protein